MRKETKRSGFVIVFKDRCLGHVCFCRREKVILLDQDYAVSSIA